MTREQLIKHWEVIKAFKEGKILKVRFGDSFIDDSSPSFGFYEEYLVEDNKIQTKRLPTIEEVEKWFMENRVFVRKQTSLCLRIKEFDKKEVSGTSLLIWEDQWMNIERFCEDFTHYDGSELYITENEKQKLTYGGEIADFPIEIVERMLECQVEQGNKRDVSVFELKKSAEKVDGGFYWGSTKERGYFWCKVIDDKNFYLFFQKYPKKQ